MIDYNRLSVVKNPYQGEFKRVLCVCSGGVLRSPTTAWILSNLPYNCNTRSCGTEDYALVKLDEALAEWADEIVVMTKEHEIKVRKFLESFGGVEAKIICLGIPDNFAYRDEELQKLIRKAYEENK